MAGRFERGLVLAATVLVLAVNALATMGWINGLTPGAVSARHELPFTPAGWIFSIWGLIYLGVIAFTVYQLAGVGARAARLRPVRGAYLVSCVANVTWLLLWHYEATIASLAVMLLLLASLATVHGLLSASPPSSGREAWCVDVPFSLYLGWISVATLANLGVAIVHGGVLPAGVSPVLWSQAMLGVALVIAATGFFRLRDPVFLAALAWAAVGIAHKTGQAPGIAVPAMALAGLAGLAMISLLRRGVGPARPPQSTTG
jgi:hypothetical protein